MPVLLTEHEVAKQLRVSITSLRRWRLLRKGPPFLKLGALVRYQPEEIEAWLSAQPTGSRCAVYLARPEGLELPTYWFEASGYLVTGI
jgi:hypothetical protein